MAINITKVVNEINSRLLDSGYSDVELTQLLAASSRIENSGINALTYRSTGHLPSTADSDRIGSIAYVAADNVFGDSSGRFYYASTRDSGWIAITTLQDSDEGAIADPSVGGGGGAPAYQGSSYGYIVAANSPLVPGLTTERYSFTSDGNSTNIINFSDARQGMTGGQGTTKGYVSAGYYAPLHRDDIWSFPYANADAWTDTTYSLTLARYRGNHEAVGPPDRSTCYVMGGNTPASTNVIEKFGTEGSEANSTDVGDLIAVNQQGAGQASPTYGYLVGGYTSGTPTTVDTIQKVSFASDGNATDVGNLTIALYIAAASSSTENGYTMGGRNTTLAPTGTQVIQKHPFASDANSTATGGLLTALIYNSTGTSSTTHGYSAAGYSAPVPGTVDTIEKFPFAADTNNATDVGDLTGGQQWGAGLQN